MSTKTPDSEGSGKTQKLGPNLREYLAQPVAVLWITRFFEALSLLTALLWSLEATAAADHPAVLPQESQMERADFKQAGAEVRIKTSLDLINSSALPSTTQATQGSRAPSSLLRNQKGSLSFIETGSNWKPQSPSENSLNPELLRSENASPSYQASPCFAYSTFVVFRFGKQD